MNAEPAPSQPDGYWSKYPTIVITWPARLVFGRISKADGRKLVKQAEQASQEALL